MKKDAKIDDALCTICEFSDSCDNLVLASVVSCTERTKCVCGARGAEANGKSISSDIKHIILISTFPFFYVMLVCYSYDQGLYAIVCLPVETMFTMGMQTFLFSSRAGHILYGIHFEQMQTWIDHRYYLFLPQLAVRTVLPQGIDQH